MFLMNAATGQGLINFFLKEVFSTVLESLTIQSIKSF